MIIQDGKMYMVRGDDESFEATITDDSGAAYEMQDGDVLVFTVRAWHGFRAGRNSAARRRMMERRP